MIRAAFAATVVGVALAGCTTADVTRHPEPTDATTSAYTSDWETSPEGRLRFGCAVHLGFAGDDIRGMYYINWMTRLLFTSSVEAEPTHAGARLWSASDPLVEGDDVEQRRRLRRVCVDLGFLVPEPGHRAIEAYMCNLNADLLRDRPMLVFFGPEGTAEAPGDHRHHDPFIIAAAALALAFLDDSWDVPDGPVSGFGATPDDDAYRDGLRGLGEHCQQRLR